MAQEFWDVYNQMQREMKQLEEKVIDFLESNGIEFKVDGDMVMIKGDLGFAELSGYDVGPEIVTMIQGDKKITWESYKAGSMLKVGGVGTPDYDKYIALPRDIHVYYSKPYLHIVFRPNLLKLE